MGGSGSARTPRGERGPLDVRRGQITLWLDETLSPLQASVTLYEQHEMIAIDTWECGPFDIAADAFLEALHLLSQRQSEAQPQLPL